MPSQLFPAFDITGVLQKDTEAVLRQIKTDLNRERIFNIKDHGAVGDGVTDDRAAIQRTLDLIDSAGGGVLYGPAGSYNISKGGVSVPSNTLVRGDGWSTIFQPDMSWDNTPKDADAQGLFNLVGTIKGVSFADLAFDGREADFIADGGRFHASESIHPNGPGAYPIMIYAYPPITGDTSLWCALTVFNTYVKDCSFESYWGGAEATAIGNKFVNCGNGLVDEAIGGSWGPLPALQFHGDKCIAMGNRFIDCGSCINGTALAPIIVGNQIVNQSGDALSIGDGGKLHSGIIAANHVDFVSRSSADFASAPRGIFIPGTRWQPDPTLEEDARVVITGNTINVDWTDDAHPQPTCLMMSTGYKMSVTGNVFRIKHGGRGIWCQTGGFDHSVDIFNNQFDITEIERQVVAIYLYARDGNAIYANSGNNSVRGIDSGNTYTSWAYDYTVDTDPASRCYSNVNNDFCEYGVNRFSLSPSITRYYPNGELDNQPFSFRSDQAAKKQLFNPEVLELSVFDADDGGGFYVDVTNPLVDLSTLQTSRVNLLWNGFATISRITGLTSADVNKVLLFEHKATANHRVYTFTHAGGYADGNLYFKGRADWQLQNGPNGGPAMLMMMIDKDLNLHEV